MSQTKPARAFGRPLCRRERPRAGALLASALAGLVLLAGCGPAADGSEVAAEPASAAPPREEVPVRIAEVELGRVSQIYETSTTLRAQRQATVTARTSGRVEELLVEEGERVREGEVLLRLEDAEQQIADERARTLLETRSREYERLERLLGQELVSENDIEAARRDLENARHEAALAALALERTRVRAPFSGTVVLRHLDVGATVSDGTPVYDIADTDPLEADVPVPERQVARLEAGQEVRLEIDGGTGPIDARIARVAPVVDAETGTVKVTLAVSNDARALRPGAFARVAIVTATRDNALAVPRRALVSEGRRTLVFRVRDGEGGPVAEEIEVEPGFEEAERVEIRGLAQGDAAPLAPGERIVVVGASALSEGTPLRIMNAESASLSSREGRASSAAGRGAPATS